MDMVINYMRLRHIKGSEEILKNSPYVINNPLEYKGKYHEVFKNNNPIHIEIGTGKGGFITEKAKRYPEINFIGIEKQASVLIKALDKIDSLPNLKLMQLDALKIDEVFSKEIDVLYLNFSDPWPKKKHTNRRLTSPIFLDKYDCIFKDKNNIEFKTDNRKLFEYSLMTINEKGYKIDKVSLNLYEDLDDDNVPTEYEKKFVAKGMTIYQLKVNK